ncbi:GNAT family N-acetyltransferase [Chenggangzhangella methanolivorans]|uniref:GNAT family N-acetyltransferase n=1 Tax=Chenggangzhangella methanolivorans TaxID=1437009 RepID=A0A9E6RC67_9HYPH|nr:GNAT family N-acetyltransferase [Chenggangzhangella methanolivorans]QZO01630.1 GNAT family N-acetyltransferase [Chenggangzhangella methanolivorans]
MSLDIRALTPDDADLFAPLLAAYSDALLGREAPSAPDEPYARKLLSDEEPVANVAGAFLDGRLVGFALYYDLPEAISGLRAGQLDDLYVRPDARGNGVAQKLIAGLVEEGERLGWMHLRWMVPEKNPAAALYERIAEAAPWRNFVIKIDKTHDW